MNKKILISFITPMKEQDFRVIALLKSIRSQNYPQDRIEIIIIDGGSNPTVLKEAKKYGVKIYHNPEQLAEGAGMGKDQGIWKAKGEFIVIAESDLELVGKNWINSMIEPLLKDNKLFASVPRLFVNPKDNPTNRYLSHVGVDPFAVFRSLEGQLELNPALKGAANAKGYFILKLDPLEPYCMGSNGFMFRKSLIKEVGDYAQDVEFIARIAKKGFKEFALVNNARIWHKNVKGLKDFIRKRIKWTQNYSKVYVNEKKDFDWLSDKRKFFLNVITNLLILPNLLESFKKSMQCKDPAWLLHAPLTFLSTAINIYYSLFSRKMLKQIFE